MQPIVDTREITNIFALVTDTQTNLPIAQATAIILASDRNYAILTKQQVYKVLKLK